MLRASAPTSRPFVALVLVLLGCSLAAPSSAALNRWSATGPGGGEVIALLAHPNVTGTFWAGTTAAGVFKTTDAGLTWQPASAGGIADTTVTALVLDPGNPATLWAGTERGGVWRSTNGGTNWSAANNGLTNLEVGQLVSAPGPAPTLYAGTGDGVFRSTNGGASWIARNSGLPTFRRIQALALDPLVPGRLLASIFSSGVYRTENRGDGWSPHNQGLDAGITVDRILILPRDVTAPGATGTQAIAETGSTALITDGNILWYDLLMDQLDRWEEMLGPGDLYIDAAYMYAELGGDPWEILEHLPGQPHSTAPTPTVDEPLVNILVDTETGLRGSNDLGKSWVRLGLTIDSLVFLADSRVPNRLLAGTRGSGVMLSNDDAVTWSKRSTGLVATAAVDLVLDPLTPTTVYSTTRGAGIAKSTDAGQTWTTLEQGLPTDLRLDALAIHPTNPNLLYVGTTDGVFRSSNAGTTWGRRSNGLPAPCIFDLLVDPVAPQTLYAATCDHGVHKSTDGGASWFAANGGLGDDDAYALARAGSTPPKLYAGTGNGLYASTDGGTNWLPADGGSIDLGPFRTVRAVAVDPSNPQIVYGAAEDRALQRSTDGGASWQPIASFLGPSQAADVPTIAVDPVDPTRIYVATEISRFGQPGTDVSVLRSTNRGTSWQVLDTGLGGAFPQALVVDPSNPQQLYLATDGNGVQRRTLGAAGPCVASATRLCLRNNRFALDVAWRVPAQNRQGSGQAVGLTADTGYFWFFDEDNVELVVKVLDGTGVNGHHWVFYGALSNVYYELTVTDTTTGEIHTYVNPSGIQASRGDTMALPSSLAGQTASVERREDSLATAASPLDAAALSADPVLEPKATAACTPTDNALCLGDGRFRVTVNWSVPSQGTSGQGRAVPLTADTGTFWFFSAANVELVLKILDGRPVNGHWWVAYGALSNVAYTIRVTDTQTGQFKVYQNLAGTLASRTDVAAF